MKTKRLDEPAFEIAGDRICSAFDRDTGGLVAVRPTFVKASKVDQQFIGERLVQDGKRVVIQQGCIYAVNIQFTWDESKRLKNLSIMVSTFWMLRKYSAGSQ